MRVSWPGTAPTAGATTAQKTTLAADCQYKEAAPIARTLCTHRGFVSSTTAREDARPPVGAIQDCVIVHQWRARLCRDAVDESAGTGALSHPFVDSPEVGAMRRPETRSGADPACALRCGSLSRTCERSTKRKKASRCCTHGKAMAGPVFGNGCACRRGGRLRTEGGLRLWSRLPPPRRRRRTGRWSRRRG